MSHSFANRTEKPNILAEKHAHRLPHYLPGNDHARDAQVGIGHALDGERRTEPAGCRRSQPGDEMTTHPSRILRVTDHCDIW